MTTGVRLACKSIVTLEVMLFFGLWFFYAALINQKNIDDYPQQQIEAIVDQHRFSVEDVTAWKVYGDYFNYEGHTYSNKNLGQALIGSIAYAHLRLVGVSYAGDRVFAAALVIFFSSCLFTALGAVALYRLGRDLTGKRTIIWPLAAALVWALCTTQTVFAGVPWHDTLAASMLVMAVYVLYKVRSAALTPEMSRNLSVVAGFLLGMIITTSMSLFFVVMLFGVYFLTMRRWKLLLPFLAGGFVGVAPVPIYNFVLFHDPFLLPAVASFRQAPNLIDAYFFFEWDNFSSKIIAYYQMISWYTPILWLGLAGLFLLPAKVRREQLFLMGAIFVLAFYMFNILGFGVCGYGPRYLMPIMPFCALGIVGLGNIPTKVLKIAIGGVAFWLAVVSFRINVVGAIGGALLCSYGTNGYPGYVNKILAGPLPNFPLLGPSLSCLVLWCVWAVYSQRRAFEENLPVSESGPSATATREFSGLIGPIKRHKFPIIIIIAIAALVAFIPLYRVLFSSKENPAASPQPAAAPPSIQPIGPVNAFDGGEGKGPGQFSIPRGLTVDNAGNIYVADGGNARVQEFDPAGNFLLTFGAVGPGEGELREPNGIAIDNSGNIFVTDAASGSLIKFTPDGKFVREWKGPDPGFYGPRDIAFGPNNQLYIVDQGRTRIVQFDAAHDSFTAWGTAGAGPGEFSGSTGITVGGNEVFVADLGNDRIQVFDLNGKFLREWAVPVWGTYPWHYPDIAFDEVTKTVYVTNGWKNQVLAFDVDGNQVTGEIPSDSVATLSNPSSLRIAELRNERRLFVLNTGTETPKVSSFSLQGRRPKASPSPAKK